MEEQDTIFLWHKVQRRIKRAETRKIQPKHLEMKRTVRMVERARMEEILKRIFFRHPGTSIRYQAKPSNFAFTRSCRLLPFVEDDDWQVALIDRDSRPVAAISFVRTDSDILVKSLLSSFWISNQIHYYVIDERVLEGEPRNIDAAIIDFSSRIRTNHEAMKTLWIHGMLSRDSYLHGETAGAPAS